MSVFDCQGQERAIGRLQRALHARRVPHSYIFHGPEGVGKYLLARQWGKVLLCNSRLERELPGNGAGAGPEDFTKIEDCCDACRDCRLVDAGTHPDYHIITRELAKYTKKKRKSQLLELPIDVIREFVIDQAGAAPSRGRARLFIIDQAETMSPESQNALLKTLEEPPANTFIILITSRLYVMLPTVRSRCQSIRFEVLPGDLITEKLNEQGVPPAEASLWADLSEGSLGRALELAEMLSPDTPKKLVNLVNTINYENRLEAAGWIVDQAKHLGGAYQKLHPEVSGSDATRRGQRYYLNFLNFIFHQAIRCLSGMPVAVRLEGIEQTGRRYGLQGCSRAIRCNLRTEGGLGLNVNPALLFESLMLQYKDYACYNA